MGTKSLMTDKVYDDITQSALNTLQDPKQKEKLLTPLTQEADVIMVSVIIGFACTRYYQNQHCQFDIEHPNDDDYALYKRLDGTPGQEPICEEDKKKYEKFLKDMQEFISVMDAVSVVIGYQEPEMDNWLKDGQSPAGREGELITGKKGGEMAPYAKRKTRWTFSKSQMVLNALQKKDSVYQGRGAYTGVVDNPITPNEDLFPTMRVMPPPSIRKWNGIEGASNWGLIRTNEDSDVNLNPDKKIGMGPLPADNQNAQVGYIHGMCSAVVCCQASGPWATPYEMATGRQTTKMASCFPCTTFMYSTGYPPSSTHLGRGESWVPPQSSDRLELKDDNPSKKKTNCNPDLSASDLKQWNRDIFSQMKLGCECLLKAGNKINLDHRIKLYDLQNRLKTYTDNDITASGGGLFLDALTLHDSELNRLSRVLDPLVKSTIFIVNRTLAPNN